MIETRLSQNLIIYDGLSLLMPFNRLHCVLAEELIWSIEIDTGEIHQIMTHYERSKSS